MSIAVALPNEPGPPRAAAFVADAAGLARIRSRELSIVIWPRAAANPLATLLARLDPTPIGRVRIEAPLADLAAALTAALAAPHLEPLREDALAGAACLARIAGAAALRLLCTYLGPGTEWLPDPAEPRTIHAVPTLAMALLKGRAAADGAACIHRSPPIAGRGVRRLLLAVDPLPPSGG